MDPNGGEARIPNGGQRRENRAIRAAERLSERKDYAAAISELRAAMEQLGPSARLSFALGEVLDAAGRPEQARWHFDDAIHLGDESARAYHASGFVRLKLKRYEEAERRFERAVTADENLLESWYWWGVLLVTLGRHEEALKKFDEVGLRGPSFGIAHLAAGEALRFLGRDEDALERYKRALVAAQTSKATPDIALAREALSRLGMTLHHLERHFDALECLNRALHLAPDEAISEPDEWRRGVHLVAAVSAMELKRHTQASHHATALLDADFSTAAYGHALLAAVGAQQGDYGSAWRHYAEMHSDYVRLRGLYSASSEGEPFASDLTAGMLELLGQVFTMLGEFEEAEEVLDIACTSDTGGRRASAWMTRMSLYLQRRDEVTTEDARRWHWKAQECARVAQGILQSELAVGRSAHSLQDLGTLFVAIEDWEKAERHLREALELRPDLDDARATLAIACAGRGDRKEAVRQLQSIRASDPDRLDDRVRLAEVLQMEDALDPAEDELRAVILVAPRNVRARIALAQVLLARGDRGEAGSYAEAHALLKDAIRMSDETRVAVARERTASEWLGCRRLSEALYAQGYARFKENETRLIGRVTLSHQSSLEETEKLFKRAASADPSNFRAERAANVLREHRAGRVATRLLEEVGAPLIAMTSLLLLLLVQSSFFFGWPYSGRSDRGLEVGYYVMLTFGLLIFLIAACYLPHVLRLKVAGVELEKEARAPTTEPLSLDITRVTSKFDLGPNIIPAPRPEPMWEAPVRKSRINVAATRQSSAPGEEPDAGLRSAEVSAETAGAARP